jgi:hypothetical protein
MYITASSDFSPAARRVLPQAFIITSSITTPVRKAQSRLLPFRRRRRIWRTRVRHQRRLRSRAWLFCRPRRPKPLFCRGLRRSERLPPRQHLRKVLQRHRGRRHGRLDNWPLMLQPRSLRPNRARYYAHCPDQLERPAQHHGQRQLPSAHNCLRICDLGQELGIRPSGRLTRVRVDLRAARRDETIMRLFSLYSRIRRKNGRLGSPALPSLRALHPTPKFLDRQACPDSP